MTLTAAHYHEWQRLGPVLFLGIPGYVYYGCRKCGDIKLVRRV